MAVAGISALLEGVREAAPDLVPSLLALAAPSLTPRNSCQEGDYLEVGGRRVMEGKDFCRIYKIYPHVYILAFL